MTTHQVQIVSEVSLPFPRGHSQTRHRLSPSQQSHAFTGIYAHQVSAWSELTLPLRKFFLADIEEFRRRWTHCAKASTDGELRNTYGTLIAAPSCRLATGWVVFSQVRVSSATPSPALSHQPRLQQPRHKPKP